ncbi:MAG TPA: GNAT family N-acetyltransferase [Thermoanaerobaculia bacterium]|nr:GNAT family N-acetyltransferase [Thermoanaerobaculia bacterium]
MPANPYEKRSGDALVSDDPSRLDLDIVHGFLSRSYWAEGIARETVARSIAGSLAFGLYLEQTGRQVGFARVITDRVTFAYLADVFLLEEERGRGLAAFLMEAILAHPELQGLRRWSLVTRDAHGLYRKFGFVPLASPDLWMELHRPYRGGAA